MEGFTNQSSPKGRQDRTRSAVLVFVGFVVWVGVSVAVRPVAASGEATSAAGSTAPLHAYLEIFQLFAGVIAVGTAYLALQTIRGGYIASAFYSLSAGVVTFLVQRLWHSIHEFGFVSFPGLAEQTLLLVATVLMAIGFLQTYNVMQPT